MTSSRVHKIFAILAILLTSSSDDVNNFSNFATLLTSLCRATVKKLSVYHYTGEVSQLFQLKKLCWTISPLYVIDTDITVQSILFIAALVGHPLSVLHFHQLTAQQWPFRIFRLCLLSFSIFVYHPLVLGTLCRWSRFLQRRASQ